MLITKTKDALGKINKNTDDVPWYFGRKFWGVLVGLSVLPNILLTSAARTSLFKSILMFLKYMPGGLYAMLGRSLNQETGKYIIILYYTLLGLLFYLTFKRKKVKIIFSLLIISTFLMGAIGFWAILAFSS